MQESIGVKPKFTDKRFYQTLQLGLKRQGMAKALNILKSTVKLRRRELFLVEATVFSLLLLTVSVYNPSSCEGGDEYAWASVTAQLYFGTSFVYHKGERIEVPRYGIELRTGIYFPVDSGRSLYELFSPEFDEKGVLHEVQGFPDIVVNVLAPSETKLEDIYVSIYIYALRRVEIRLITLIILDGSGLPIEEYPLYAGMELGPLSWNDKPYVIRKLLALPVRKWGYGIYNYAIECQYEFNRESFNLTLLGHDFRQAYLNLYGEEPRPTGYFRLCIPLKTAVVEVPTKELEQKYHALEAAYDHLKSVYESTHLELNTTRLLMYSFIATTITFAVATIYFAKRRPKVT